MRPRCLPAPLAGVEVLVTRGCGPGLAQRLAGQGVAVLLTRQLDPRDAWASWRGGRLVAASPRPPGASCDHDGCD